MKNIMMPIGVLFFFVIAGCASAPEKTYHRTDVNRVVEPIAPAPHGSLKVYTETDDSSNGEPPHYYPHLPYMLYTPEGKKYKYVRNHWSSQDEYPEIVELPPGKYVIVPETKFTKREIVGVVIEDGKMVEVHLKGE